MQKNHLDEVVAIETRSFPTPWTKSSFESHLEHPEFAYYLVALDNEKVIGYAGLFFGGDQGQITNISISQTYHRQGIGSRLLRSIIEFSIAKGIVHLSLEVRKDNKSAQNLYSKFGFKIVGTRKGYYQETGEDAYVMCLFDLQGEDDQ